MSKRNWITAAALGLVAGVAISFLFLVWAVPEFRNPFHQHVAQEAASERDSSEERKELGEKSQWRHWAERFINLEDTLAQWLMALFAVLATGVSLYGVRLLKQTLDATRASADAAVLGLKIARQTARPYLVLVDIQMSYSTSFISPGSVEMGIVSISATVKNSGKGGAILEKVKYQVTHGISAHGMSGENIYQLLIVEGGDFQIEQLGGSGTDRIQMDKFYADSAKERLGIIGYVQYRDMFGVRRRTHYGYIVYDGGAHNFHIRANPSPSGWADYEIGDEDV